MSLVCRDLSFSYAASARGTGARHVLHAVSATFAPGRVTAIIGPNGCGKSTLLKLMLGLLTPDAGTITLGNEPVAHLPRDRRARALVYLPQSSSLAFSYTAAQVVAMGRLVEGASAADAAIHSALSRVAMADRADDPMEHLSAGQRQRVTLARALGQIGLACDGPRAMLCDEPVSAMDPRHAQQSLAILRDLARTTPDIAVVVVLHDLTAALHWADDVLALGADGRVAAAGPAVEVLTPATLSRLFKVGCAVIEGGGRRAIVFGGG